MTDCNHKWIGNETKELPEDTLLFGIAEEYVNKKCERCGEIAEL